MKTLRQSRQTLPISYHIYRCEIGLWRSIFAVHGRSGVVAAVPVMTRPLGCRCGRSGINTAAWSSSRIEGCEVVQPLPWLLGLRLCCSEVWELSLPINYRWLLTDAIGNLQEIHLLPICVKPHRTSQYAKRITCFLFL